MSAALIYRIETNYGLHHVSHVSVEQVRAAMAAYLRDWTASGRSLASAKFVYNLINLTRRLPNLVEDERQAKLFGR